MTDPWTPPKNWRWMDGMLAVWPVDGSCWRVVEVAEDMMPVRVIAVDDYALNAWGLAGQPGAAGRLAPDLTDPATVGCLLALARELWGDPHMCVRTEGYGRGGRRWFLDSWAPAHRGDYGPRRCGSGTTEAEAIIDAIDAAPVTP